MEMHRMTYQSCHNIKVIFKISKSERLLYFVLRHFVVVSQILSQISKGIF